MDSQILTGLIAAIGLLANFAGVGDAAAEERADPARQDGHGQHAEPGHHHADFTSDRLHVRVDGQAGPGVRDIILIPGLSSSPEVWQGTVDHLGAGWRVHRIHIQGFAGAPVEGNATGPVAAPVAEEIARYISEQGLDHPVVVGHSMGGTIGMMLAARRPDAIGKLMVVDMLPSLGPVFAGPTATRAEIEAAGQRTHDGIVSETGQARIDSANETISGMIRTGSKRAGPIQDTLTSDTDVMARSMQELVVTDVSSEFGDIRVPVEVLYVAFPQAGPSATDAIYRAAFAGLPNVTLKRIDDSAHFIMLDQPDAFYADLDAFLAE